MATNYTRVHDFFPQDILVDILLPLPIKSLVRFSSVSKSWNELIYGSQFAKLRQRLTSNDEEEVNNYILVSTSSHGYLESLRSDSSEDDDFGNIRVSRLAFPRPINPHERLKLLGSCNGLVAVSLSLDYSLDLFIWNPTTGQYKELPYPCRLTGRPSDRLIYGFGYESSSQDYKLLIGDSNKPSEAEIFSLRENKWTRIENPPCPGSVDHYVVQDGCAFVNGALHWILFTKSETIILAFDLKTEEFRKVPLHPHPRMLLYGYQYKGALGVVKDKLCITISDGNLSWFGLWVMEEYGNKKSWTKLFHKKGKLKELVNISERHIVYTHECEQHVIQLVRRRFDDEAGGKDPALHPICHNWERYQVIGYRQSFCSPNYYI